MVISLLLCFKIFSNRVCSYGWIGSLIPRSCSLTKFKWYILKILISYRGGTEILHMFGLKYFTCDNNPLEVLCALCSKQLFLWLTESLMQTCNRCQWFVLKMCTYCQHCLALHIKSMLEMSPDGLQPIHCFTSFGTVAARVNFAEMLSVGEGCCFYNLNFYLCSAMLVLHLAQYLYCTYVQPSLFALLTVT